MSAPLEGRVAIVTGSSRGIGAAIVQRLAADGARVVVNYLNSQEAADNVVNAINSSRDGAAIGVKADASTIIGGERLLEECMKAFGRLDILVLNAGVGVESTISEVDPSIFDATFNVHVKGPLFLTKSAATQLSEGTQGPVDLRLAIYSLIILGGRIIFISSYVTRKSTVMPYSLVQASSKGAIDQIARTLAKELGARCITVNTISPGPIDTAILRQGASDHKMQFVANIHPQKRLGMPSDIAPMVAFLATPEAGWISGQNIHINGVITFHLIKAFISADSFVWQGLIV
jgi:3-oxoacyl-[acyl-carrier protein] reductase